MGLKEEVGLRVFRVTPSAPPPPLGAWKYRKGNNTLAYCDGNGKEWYHVDLDLCRSAGSTLDWIVQVAQKGHWATPEVVGLLVIAIDKRLNLQGSQCGGLAASGG